MSVSMIAAVGRNNELGKDNELIWRFHADMVFFRETTTGCVVIMGRKTFESLPKVLPKRKNIIITKNKDYTVDGAFVVSGIEDALSEADSEKAFVIGGSSIYEQFLPYADEMYLTEIDAECDTADAYFPDFDKSEWNRTVLAENEENGVKFSHVLYTKK